MRLPNEVQILQLASYRTGVSRGCQVDFSEPVLRQAKTPQCSVLQAALQRCSADTRTIPLQHRGKQPTVLSQRWTFEGGLFAAVRDKTEEKRIAQPIDGCG